MRCFVAGAAASFLLAACTSSDGQTGDPPCVGGLTPDCAATYDPPTFATIHAKILKPTCATGTGTCHTSDAAMGGLVLEDAHRSYQLLLGENGGKARVLAHDPSCSLLEKRLNATDPGYRMPRGPTPLSAGDICTITKWIAAGAAE